MPKLAVDGGKVKIHYEVKGKGKTKVILIIGFSTTYTSWEKQFEYFGDKHGDEFTVCVFDNRGMGTLRVYATFVVCVIINTIHR